MLYTLVYVCIQSIETMKKTITEEYSLVIGTGRVFGRVCAFVHVFSVRKSTFVSKTRDRNFKN